MDVFFFYAPPRPMPHTLYNARVNRIPKPVTIQQGLREIIFIYAVVVSHFLLHRRL